MWQAWTRTSPFLVFPLFPSSAAVKGGDGKEGKQGEAGHDGDDDRHGVCRRDSEGRGGGRQIWNVHTRLGGRYRRECCRETIVLLAYFGNFQNQCLNCSTHCHSLKDTLGYQELLGELSVKSGIKNPIRFICKEKEIQRRNMIF